MNKVILMGRLTRDVEMRQTPGGASVARFSIAVNRRFKNSEGNYDADFINCVAWRQTAEFVSRYFNKGSMICVEGNLRTSSYQDRNHSDVTHYRTEVFVDNVEFTGSKRESGTGGGSNYSAPQNGYNNNYQSPQQQAAPQQPAQNNDSMAYGSLSDFEEILSDGDVPF